MEKLRTVIADDEKPARRRLLELLSREADIEVVGECACGHEAVDQVRRKRPDLLFLDVQMPEKDGFGVVDTIGAERMPVTVFVTAYDGFAIRAFEAQALDYLLKPYSDERFETALDRARRSVRDRRAAELIDRGEKGLERIVLKSTGRVRFVDVPDIDWIEAAGVYVNLHVGDSTHLHRATLGGLLEQLDPRRFVRVHRSAAVNSERIREMRPLNHGDYQVILRDGTELRLSRSYRAEVERWLGRAL